MKETIGELYELSSKALIKWVKGILIPVEFRIKIEDDTDILEMLDFDPSKIDYLKDIIQMDNTKGKYKSSVNLKWLAFLVFKINH